jgi:replication factor C large subunit
MWVEKHRPINPFQMVGNEEIRLRFLKWLKGWKRGDKPVLLIGPPGTGKTTLVYAAAKFLGYSVLELNASDFRTRDRLERTIGPALTSASVLGEKVLVFLDEVDGMYGVQDYGGFEFISKVVNESYVPIVMAANSEDNERVKKLSSICETLKVKRVPLRLVEVYLRGIIEREGIKVSDELIYEVVKQNRGDVRASVNSLQASVGLGKAVVGIKDMSLELRDGIRSFFDAKDEEEAFDILNSTHAQPQDKIRLIYSSLVKGRLSLNELSFALKTLSIADTILGRILKTQEWRLLRYLDRVLAYQLKQVIERGKVELDEDHIPWSVKVRIWNDSRVIREFASRVSKSLHTSSRDVIENMYFYLMVVLSNDEEKIKRLARVLNLSEKELKVIKREASRILLPKKVEYKGAKR